MNILLQLKGKCVDVVHIPEQYSIIFDPQEIEGCLYYNLMTRSFDDYIEATGYEWLVIQPDVDWSMTERIAYYTCQQVLEKLITVPETKTIITCGLITERDWIWTMSGIFIPATTVVGSDVTAFALVIREAA